MIFALRCLAVAATLFSWAAFHVSAVLYTGLGTSDLFAVDEVARIAVDTSSVSGQRTTAVILAAIFGAPSLLLSLFLWTVVERQTADRRSTRKVRSGWSLAAREDLLTAWIDGGATRYGLDDTAIRQAIQELEPADSAAISRLAEALDAETPNPQSAASPSVPRSHRSHRVWFGAFVFWSIAACKLVFAAYAFAISHFATLYGFDAPLTPGQARIFIVSWSFRAVLLVYLGTLVAFVGSSRRRHARFEETLIAARSREVLAMTRRLLGRLADRDIPADTKRRVRRALIDAAADDLLPTQSRCLVHP